MRDPVSRLAKLLLMDPREYVSPVAPGQVPAPVWDENKFIAGRLTHDVHLKLLQGFWKKPETALHYVGMLQDLTGENMSSAVASKLGAASWARAEEKSAQAGPLDFLVD